MTEKQIESTLADIRNRLAQIEKHVSELQDSVHSVERRTVSRKQASLCSFPAVCRILLRYGAISPSLLLPPTLRSPVTSKLVEILLSNGRATISGLSRDYHSQFGGGSRQTISKHLQALSEEGVVVVSEIGSSKSFRLSDTFLIKWLNLIDDFSQLYKVP